VRKGYRQRPNADGEFGDDPWACHTQSVNQPNDPSDQYGTLQPMCMRVCQGPTCGVRFPVAVANVRYETCHLCQAPTVVSDPIDRLDITNHTSTPPRRQITAVLDNVRSAQNVGAILRTCDGVGIRRVLIGGISPTPANPKVIKTALGAEADITWSQHRNLLPAIDALDVPLIALEATPSSVLFDATLELPAGPLAVVVGNEVSGIDPAIQERAHLHVHLPMRGVKNSLNVAVAFGAFAYGVR